MFIENVTAPLDLPTISGSLKDSVYLAKLAEQAERYEGKLFSPTRR